VRANNHRLIIEIAAPIRAPSMNQEIKPSIIDIFQDKLKRIVSFR